MQTTKRIMQVAVTEARIVSRSWIFRFFTLIAVIGLGIANVYLFIPFDALPGGAHWWVRSVPASVPYFTVFLLTAVESLILMFGAVESIHRERSYNSSASLQARNVPNVQFILGKALGLMIPFVILDAAILSMLMAINEVFMLDVPVIWQAYLLYPLLITVPTVVFITGLSLAVANSVKHTSFAMLILLFLIMLPYIQVPGQMVRILDYNAMRVPMLYSDFIGFGNVSEILLHRFSYLLAGIGLIAVAVVLFRRLQQWPLSRKVAVTIAAFCMIIASITGAAFLYGISAETTLREHVQALNEEYVQYPRPRLDACYLDITHQGSTLSAKATLSIRNQYDYPLEHVYLSLNSGFRVSEVVRNSTSLGFSQDTQIIDILLDTPLGAQESCDITVTYNGAPDDRAMYPDIDEQEHMNLHRLFTYIIDKRHAFVTSDYILLTPESLWYPITGIPYGVVFPEAYQKDFIDFSFDLTTDTDNTVITQGDVTRTDTGDFHVTADSKLPGLTLIVGTYEERAADIDGITVKLYTRPGHDYFTEYFDGHEDKVVETLRVLRAELESSHEMEYPYARFMLVEAPIQFYAYDRPWRTYMDTVQPQMSIMAERGSFMVNMFDFRELFGSEKKRSNRDYTTEPIIESTVATVFYTHFEDDELARTTAQRLRIHPRSFTFDPHMLSMPNYFPRYSMTAQFFPYLVSFEFEDYPVCNSLIEWYCNSSRQNGSVSTSRYGSALLSAELGSIALAEEPFSKYLQRESDYDTMSNILGLKTSQLIGLLSAESDSANFIDTLRDTAITQRFNNLSLKEFGAMTGIEQLPEMLDGLYNQTGQPFYHFSDLTATEVTTEMRTVWQNTMTITNTEPAPGMVLVRYWDSDGEQKRYVYFSEKQSKEVGIVTDNELSRITVDTFVSKNLPNKFYQLPKKLHSPDTVAIFDGERNVPYQPPYDDPEVIIVDNIDEGFEIVRDPAPQLDHVDYEFGKNPGGYILSNAGRPPSHWGKAIFIDAYGDIRTAHYIKHGPGDGEVCWTAKIVDYGRYELEYYLNDISNGTGYYIPEDDPDYEIPVLGEYHLSVVCGDTYEPVIFEPVEKGGWQYVSTFDLEPGPVAVHLTNESNGRCIYADAIRWVKR